MNQAYSQLTLDLPHRAAQGAEDFLVTPCNEQAVAQIDRWPDWTYPALMIHGAKGAGKSHLASVWQDISGATRVEARELMEKHVPDLIERGHVVVEDLEGLSEPAALFHMFNLAREEGRQLLLTALAPVSRLNLGLPDLVSRLNAAPSVKLEEPDDQLMKALFMKLFADRQLLVKTEVIDFLTLRLDRSYEAILSSVEGLDQLALSSGRPITVPLAKNWLESRA